MGPFWRAYAIPAAVAVAGIALSLLLHRWVGEYEQQRIASEFQRRTENVARVLSSGIDSYVNLVESYGNQSAIFNRRLQNTEPADLLRIQGEWENLKPVIRQTIEDARAHFPGIRAMGWASRIGRENRVQFESVARLVVAPDYQLRELSPDNAYQPVSDRAEYVPVFYCEPAEDAELILGLDISLSNKVGSALTAAASRDAVTASEPIRLIREMTGQLGIFMIAPIYQGGSTPDTVERRLDSVVTYLFTVVLVDDLLTSALAGLDEPGIDFFIYPGPEDLSPRSLTSQPVYASNGNPASIESYRTDPAFARFSHQGVINVAGQSWDIYSFPTRGFIQTYDTWMPEVVLLFSGLFSVFVAAYLSVFTGRAERVSQLVAQRTRELELSNKALEAEIAMRRAAESQKRGLESQLYQAQRMDSIGNLAGGIAHDFNNILLAVLGYIDLSRASDGLSPKVSKYLDSAKSAGDRAVTLTRQLLAFGRRQALAVAPHDINDIVAGFENILERIVPENIRYTFNRSDKPCVVLGDAGQLEQVVMNLVVNACEAMPDGGALTLSVDRVELGEQELAGRPTLLPGTYVRLTVTDTGAGIATEDIERIFEPFFSTKSHRQGTGLGLAVVYGIVEQHGGFIEAQSDPDTHTSFSVYLPRTSERPVQSAVAPAVPAKGGSETILIVEDEAEVRTFAQMVLEQAGYRVLLAEDGYEGLETFKRHKDEVALVFADVVMPEMGGRDLSTAIHAIDPTMPVILTSGYLGGDDEQYFLGREVNFIAKPYSPVALRTEVRRVLDRAHVGEAPRST